MTKLNIDLTSKITQENESETFHKEMPGQIKRDGEIIRVSYLEDGEIPVKMLLKDDELIIKRGSGNNYSFMRFNVDEKEECRYVVEGRQMDLTSVTKLLEFEENETSSKLHVEYDLYSGLYLIGNYTVTLIFT